MANRPHITLQQIRTRASGQSFSRGESYYNTDAVTNTIRRGDEIEALCQGSYPEPYRVWAQLDKTGIVATRCNCEYDWGGDCKHVVALLLTYLHQPDQFEARQTLQEGLLKRSKEDLIDIIMLMVTRYPDLQTIVDSPTPNEVVTGQVPLDTLSVRQQLRDAFVGYVYDDGYGQDFAPSRAMNQAASVADRLSQRGDWPHAAAVYRTILEEFAKMDEGYFYPHDDLYDSLYRVTAALEQCLTQPAVDENDDERRAILNALLGVFIWDMQMGGYGLSDDMPELILRFTHREDIAAIRKRVEAARDQQMKRYQGNWGAEAYITFLTELDMLDEVDQDVLIGRLYGYGMDYLLTAKLLAFGRLDEAIDVIQNNMEGAFEQKRALNLLAERGQEVKAQQLAEDILASKYDYDLARWLLDRYRANGNQEGLLRWQKRQMAERPSVQNYGELKTIAQALGQWDDLRPQIIRDLDNRSEYPVLTQVYLHDGEWALAWDTLPKVRGNTYYGRSLELDVADASYRATPKRAIPVFIKYARQHIDKRGRDNYQQAASLLAKVQQAYDQLDEIETWETLIAELRQEHKRLPALKDELNKAGL